MTKFQKFVRAATRRRLSRAILPLLAIGMLSNVSAAPETITDDAARLSTLDHAMQRAVVDRDAKAFASFLTDDYVLITSSSKRIGKADVVAAITAADAVMTVNDSSNLDVRIHGDTALVIADLHQVGSQNGKPFDYWVRYTDTWIRQNGTWLCVSGHASLLKPSP
jgi:uncharacterized protein (TIGR02246 family)